MVFWRSRESHCGLLQRPLIHNIILLKGLWQSTGREVVYYVIKSPHTLVENPEMNHLTFFTSLDWNPNCIRQCNYVTVEEFNPVKMLIDEIIMINVAAAGDVGSLYKYVAADLPSLALLGSLVSQLWRAAAGWTAPMSQLL